MFYTIDCSVYRVEFEIVIEIRSVIERLGAMSQAVQQAR